MLSHCANLKFLADFEACGRGPYQAHISTVLLIQRRFGLPSGLYFLDMSALNVRGAGGVYDMSRMWNSFCDSLR
jgi:hypothetical protein